MQVRKGITSILFSLVLALAESRIIIEDVQESEIIILLNKHGHKESVSQQIYVDSGENFTLTCATVHSYANDGVSLRWFKTKKVLLREGEYLVKEEPMESSNPLTLSFSPVDISDAGSYMCKHLHSNMQRSVYIKVNTPHSGDASVNVIISKIREDGVEENAPENLEVWEGNRFTLRCKANNNLPALSKLNLISSTENGEDVFKESFINDNELKFDPIRLTDTGIYSCSDNHGNESKTVHITVKPHPEQGFPQNHDHAEQTEEDKKKHAQSSPETGSFLASRFETGQDLEDANKPKHLKPVEHEKPNNSITFNDEEEKLKNQKNFENEDNSNNKHLNEQVDVLQEKNSHGKNEKQSQQDIFGKPHDEIKDRRNEIFNKELNPKRLLQGVIEKFHKFKPGDLEGDVKHKQHDERSDIQRDKIFETENKMAGHGGPRKDDHHAEEIEEKKKHEQSTPEAGPFLASRFEAVQDLEDANKPKHLKPAEYQKPNNHITFNDEEEKFKNQKNFENEHKYNSIHKHVNKQVDILPEKYSHGKNEKQFQQDIFEKPHEEIKDRGTEFFNKDLNPKRLLQGVIEKFHKFKPGDLEGDVKHKQHDERSDIQRDKIFETENKMAGHGGPRKDDHHAEEIEEKKKHAQSSPETGSFLASRFEAVQDLENANKPKHLKPAEHQKPNNHITFNDEEEKLKNQKNFENEHKYNSNHKQVDILPEKYSHGKNEKQFQQDIFEKPHEEIKHKRNEIFNKELIPKRLLQGVIEKFHKFKPGGLEGDVKHKQHDERSGIQRDKIYETEDKMAGHGGPKKDDRDKPFLNIIPKIEKNDQPLNKFEKPADSNIDVINRRHMFDNVKSYVADSVQKFLDAFENFKNKNNLAALENRGKFPKQYSENELNSEKMDHLENRFGNENIIPSDVSFAEDEDDNIHKPFSEKIDAGEEDELSGVDHEIKNQLNDLEEEFDELDVVVEIEDLISKILTTFDEELSVVTEISKIPEWASVNDKNLIKNDIKHLLQEFKELKDLIKFEKFLSTILHELEKDSDYDWISFAHDEQEALNELLDNLKPERFNGKNKNMAPLSEKFDVPKDDLEKNGWRLADRFNDSPQEGIFDDSNEFMQADEAISENQIPKSKEDIHDTSKDEQESKKDMKMDIIDLHNKLSELEDLKEIENVQNEILKKLDDYGSTESKPADNGQNFGELPNEIAFKPNSHNDVAESSDEFNDGTFFDNPTGRKLKVYSEFLKGLRDCLEEELSIPKDAGVNEKELSSGEEWDNEGGEKEHNANENLDEEEPIVIQPRLGESDDFEVGDDYGRWHHEQENVRDWKEKSQTLPGNGHPRIPSHFKEDQIFIDDLEKDDNDADEKRTKYEYYDLEEHEGSGQEDTFYDSEKDVINSGDEMKQGNSHPRMPSHFKEDQIFIDDLEKDDHDVDERTKYEYSDLEEREGSGQEDTFYDSEKGVINLADELKEGNSHPRMPSYFKKDEIFIDGLEKDDDDDERTKYKYSGLAEHKSSGQEDMFYDSIKHDSENSVINSVEMKQDWAERHTSNKENPVDNLNDTTHSTLIIAGLSIAIALLSFALILRTWCLAECKKQKSGAEVDDESKYTLLP